MGLLDGIERLINEHGSAAILRERIAFAKDQYSALEAENKILKSENEILKLENEKLQDKLRNFESKSVNNSNPKGYVCDHCGSQSLKRTGSRPDPTFGVLGQKQALFVCLDCKKQSAFLESRL